MVSLLEVDIFKRYGETKGCVQLHNLCLHKVNMSCQLPAPGLLQLFTNKFFKNAFRQSLTHFILIMIKMSLQLPFYKFRIVSGRQDYYCSCLATDRIITPAFALFLQQTSL
jgi:hypothetical protein